MRRGINRKLKYNLISVNSYERKTEIKYKNAQKRVEREKERERREEMKIKREKE